MSAHDLEPRMSVCRNCGKDAEEIVRDRIEECPGPPEFDPDQVLPSHNPVDPRKEALGGG